METETEKIYYCDRSNDNVLAASILANSRRDDNSWPMMADAWFRALLCIE